jgi:hypothetical protein
MYQVVVLTEATLDLLKENIALLYHSSWIPRDTPDQRSPGRGLNVLVMIDLMVPITHCACYTVCSGSTDDVGMKQNCRVVLLERIPTYETAERIVPNIHGFTL